MGEIVEGFRWSRQFPRGCFSMDLSARFGHPLAVRFYLVKVNLPL